MAADLATVQRLHPEWRITGITAAPNGGMWAVGADGGVFALNAEGGTDGTVAPLGDGKGGAFSYTGLEAQYRQGTRDFTGITSNASSYTLVSNMPGETYTFAFPQPPTPTSTAAPKLGDSPVVGDGESGRDIFVNTLVNMGFTRAQASSLGNTLWTTSKTKNQDALYNDLIASAEYAERFPGMKAMRDKGTAMSESQYITLERQYEGAARSAGLPTGFYDGHDDFGKLIANGVSPAEYAGRINQAQTLALGVDPTFREEFARQLPGANLGDLTAFLLDPDKGTEMINQKYVNAQIGTSARRSGFGMLTQAEIDQLRAKEVDPNEATAGFNQLAGLEGLTTNTAGETMSDQNFTRDEKLGLVAGDVKAQTELDERLARRKAQFTGGGGSASGGSGKQGIG